MHASDYVISGNLIRDAYKPKKRNEPKQVMPKSQDLNRSLEVVVGCVKCPIDSEVI